MIGQLRRGTCPPLRAADGRRRWRSRAAGGADGSVRLGLLLGDGCLTTSDNARPSPRQTLSSRCALEAALPGIELRHKARYDYILRHVDGGRRGGVIVANPVTEALRELGLAGTRSETKFVPSGLLCTTALRCGSAAAPGPPRHRRWAGHAARPYLPDPVHDTSPIDCGTTSCSWSARWAGSPTPGTRPAAGPPPGPAPERAVHHRHDAYVMDIRLPAGIEPFRLDAKRGATTQHGGGRPMRFIDSIEPAGEQETCVHPGRGGRTRCT